MKVVFYILVMNLMVMSCFQSIYCLERESIETIKENREKLNIKQLLESPYANRKSINAMFIQPKDMNLEWISNLISKYIENEKHSSLDLASLIWLKCECDRLDAFMDAREYRDSTYVKKIPERLLPTLLHGYSILNNQSSRTPLHNDFSRSINKLLTQKDSRDINKELKRRLISEYLEKEDLSKWPAEHLVTIYKNLDCLDVLAANIPDNPQEIESTDELTKKMEILKVFNKEKAAIYATEIIERYINEKDATMLNNEIFTVIVETKPQYALAQLPGLVERDQKCWIWAYVASRKANVKDDIKKQREQWLNPYMQKVSEKYREKTNSLIHSASESMKILDNMGFPEEALLISKIVPNSEDTKSLMTYWYFLGYQAEILEKLNRRQDAYEVYLQCERASVMSEAYKRGIGIRRKKLEKHLKH